MCRSKDGRPVVVTGQTAGQVGLSFSSSLTTSLNPFPPSPYNRISPTTYLFTEHLMVKINYSWNAEMLNTGPHADNDREGVRKKEKVRETWDRSKGGTITSNRSIIDLEGR